MPTEHEYKYAIDLSLADKYSHKDLRSIADQFSHIKQGYLAFSKGMTTRIRCITTLKKERWYLTFKQKINDRVIEIEKKIDSRDGHDLWDVCVGKLKKNRYAIDNEGVTWELDLFKKGNLYFILAEVELEEGAPRPKSVPQFLKDYILYEVPLTDDRFSNKRLGDAEYATNLYKQIQKGVNDGQDKKSTKKSL